MIRVASRRAVLALLLLPLSFASGCTSVGVHVPSRRARVDFGAPLVLRVCVLRDEGVSDADVRSLVGTIDQEMELYRIDVQIAWTRPWQRPGFFGQSIVADLVSRPLVAPCDRLLAFVHRNAGDFLWGIALPEKLGEVDSATHTRGWISANVGSLGQLFTPPADTAVHEFYHMVGCRHSLTKTDCYTQIKQSKGYYARGTDFFPGLTEDRRPLRTRREVDAHLR